MTEKPHEHRAIDLLNQLRYGSEHLALAKYLIELEDRIKALEHLAYRHATAADVVAALRDIRNELHHTDNKMDLGI